MRDKPNVFNKNNNFMPNCRYPASDSMGSKKEPLLHKNSIELDTFYTAGGNASLNVKEKKRNLEDEKIDYFHDSDIISKLTFAWLKPKLEVSFI